MPPKGSRGGRQASRGGRSRAPDQVRSGDPVEPVSNEGEKPSDNLQREQSTPSTLLESSTSPSQVVESQPPTTSVNTNVLSSAVSNPNAGTEMAEDSNAGDGGESSRGARPERLDSLQSGRGAFAHSKFKPKAIGRRNQTERDALEKEAKQKEQKRLAEMEKKRQAEEKKSRLAQSGRGRGRGRGRGAPSGGMFGTRDNMTGPASGPFAGPSTEVKSAAMRGGSGIGRGGGSGGGQSGGGGGSNVTRSPEGRRSARIKAEDNMDISMSVERDSSTKIMRNVDQLSALSIEDNDGDVEFLFERRLRPVRLEREEHVDRSMAVNTEASSSKAAEIRQQELEEDGVKKEKEGSPRLTRKSSRKEKDVEFVRDERRWKGVYPEEDAAVGTQIKKEPGEDVEMSGVQVAIDPVTHTADPTAEPIDSVSKPEEPDDETLQPTVQKRHRVSRRLETPVFQTDQDQAEWDRLLFDRQALVSELKMPEPHAGEEGEEPFDKRENRVYMFQIPPKMPNLRYANQSDNVEGKGKGRANEDSTQEEAGPSNKEPTQDDNETKTRKDKHFDYIDAVDDPDFQGQIGTLSIYEDGDTEFSWGGIDFEVKVGCGGDLLQEVVVTEVPEQTEEEKKANVHGDQIVGSAMAMGQLSGRFVVTPSWNSLFERA